jgi:hypothetical protein
MPSHSQSIESEALSLPLQQRADLAAKLLESIEPTPKALPREVQKAWLQEANQRYEAFLRGEDEAIPVEQAFSELQDHDR